MIISNHARWEMFQAEISEEEVANCLEYSEMKIRGVKKGELRYGKRFQLKDKSIMVIYTFRMGAPRVVTVYPIRRKEIK